MRVSSSAPLQRYSCTVGLASPLGSLIAGKPRLPLPIDNDASMSVFAGTRVSSPPALFHWPLACGFAASFFPPLSRLLARVRGGRADPRRAAA